jgi:hypothetical protein
VTLLASIQDADGRVVELTDERWSHITERHPEIAPFIDEVLHAVSSPDRRVVGRAANELWFYMRTNAPSAWLKVVVAYAEGRGHIVTAHARRSMP